MGDDDFDGFVGVGVALSKGLRDKARAKQGQACQETLSLG
jgi:hypothetical protein